MAQLKKIYKLIYRGICWVRRKIRAFFVTLYWLPYLIMCKVKYRQSAVFCECFIKYNRYKIKINNWGDDLNLFFLGEITDKNFIFIPFEKTLFRIKRYSLIGSTIGFGNLRNLIICGSGIKNPQIRLRGRPLKIYSVRGPETRKILLSNNIECPENYGDLALLLPLFYSPDIKKKYKYGFIANEATPETEVLKCVNALRIDSSEYLIINMTNYNKWTDIIDNILSCDYIISESLHGLIVSETYKIPNCWVEFIEHESYWSFKYLDFYESINNSRNNSIKLYKDESILNEIKVELMDWKESYIDYKKLMSYFPFSLKTSKHILLRHDLMENTNKQNGHQCG